MDVLPLNILPYEKLSLLGEESLSTEELLAILIRTGTSKKSVFDISKEIIELGGNSSSLRFLCDLSINELTKIEGIGKTKAIQLKAVAEIAKRMNYPIKNKHKINSSNDVFMLFENELKFENREFLKVIILNSKNEILRIRNIAIGGGNYSFVEPKQVLSEAVKLDAPKLILVHNHPSRRFNTKSSRFSNYKKNRRCSSSPRDKSFGSYCNRRWKLHKYKIKKGSIQWEIKENQVEF